jgi:hypothetical protein
MGAYVRGDYVVAKRADGGRRYRTVVMHRRTNEIVYVASRPGWNAAAKGEAVAWLDAQWGDAS